MHKLGSKGNGRMLSIEQAAEYIGLGIGRTRKLADELNAVVRVGRRVLIDRIVLDRWIDENEGIDTTSWKNPYLRKVGK